MAQKTVQPITRSEKRDPRFVVLVGEKMRGIRQQRFGSQEVLADRAGIAVQTVANAEASKLIWHSQMIMTLQPFRISCLLFFSFSLSVSFEFRNPEICPGL